MDDNFLYGFKIGCAIALSYYLIKALIFISTGRKRVKKESGVYGKFELFLIPFVIFFAILEAVRGDKR